METDPDMSEMLNHSIFEFEYVGAGLKNTSDPKAVLMYDPTPHDGKLVLLFIGGNVSALDVDEAMEFIQRTKDLRRKQ